MCEHSCCNQVSAMSQSRFTMAVMTVIYQSWRQCRHSLVHVIPAGCSHTSMLLCSCNNIVFLLLELNSLISSMFTEVNDTPGMGGWWAVRCHVFVPGDSVALGKVTLRADWDPMSLWRNHSIQHWIKILYYNVNQSINTYSRTLHECVLHITHPLLYTVLLLLHYWVLFSTVQEESKPQRYG